MAIKGQQLKNEIAQKILKLFDKDAFFYNDGKEIRVNGLENGEQVQIKIALTAAKVAVEKDSDTAVPGDVVSAVPAIPKSEMIDFEAPAAPQPVPVPTEAEKNAIKALMAQLGL